MASSAVKKPASKSATKSAVKPAIKSVEPPMLATKSNSKLDLSQYETIALVLQGGGALGSYQAGVYEALEDAGIMPNWVSGISIGALNTAIIAGNPPGQRVERLKAFWETICKPAFLPASMTAAISWMEQATADMRKLFNAWEASRAMLEGQRGFFTPRVPSPLSGMVTGVQHASFYDTSALKATLEQFADFDRINDPRQMRVSVGAVDVENGNFDYFNNSDPHDPLLPEHFMASGALPPGFPAVAIWRPKAQQTRYYWDGGLMSNTPLYDVLTHVPRRDTLAFQVDLWSAKGNLPDNLYDVAERQKDIQFSSRTRMITDYMKDVQNQRRMLHDLLQIMPAATRNNHDLCKKAAAMACIKRFNVIHLIYQDKQYEGHFKDYEFGPLTMREHWLSGLADVERTLLHPEYFALPPEEHPFMTHDIHRLKAAK